MAAPLTIGILNLQGATEPHQKCLSSLGVENRMVRTAEDLHGLSGLILPGGESTAMLHLIGTNQLWHPLVEFFSTTPAWGICAGAILLAGRVSGPNQASFAAIDLSVHRNAYGRQRDSFVSPVTPTARWSVDQQPFPGVFIRAPKFTELGPQAETLFTCQNEPVMVQQGHTLASSFHPELTEDFRLHQYFHTICQRHHAKHNT